MENMDIFEEKSEFLKNEHLLHILKNFGHVQFLFLCTEEFLQY